VKKEISSTWSTCQLGDVVAVIRSRSGPQEHPEKPFIGMDNVEAHTMRLLGTVLAGTMKSNATHFLPGDVLYGRLRPYLNKVVAPAFEGLASAEFIPLTPEAGISTDFIRYRLNAVDFVFFTSHLDEGDRPRVDWDGIRRFVISLPPSKEQQRIVEAVDSYLTRLDDAVAALEQVKTKLKAYRASVLKAAVEGRLVPTEASLARAQKRDYEPAETLRMRILNDRRRQREAAKLAKLKAKDRPRKDDKWVAKYEEPVAIDSRGLPDLPEGWCWLTIDALAFVTKLAGFEYTKFVEYDESGDLAVIKAENAGRDGFRETNFSRVRSESVAHLTRSRLSGGDLLMVFVGAGTGNVGRVPENRPYFLGPNIAMIRVATGAMSAAYLEYFLRSPLGNGLALGFSKAVAQQSLSMGTIRRIPVVVPPREEQDRIVAALDYHTSVQVAITQQIRDELVRLARLRQSILKWAFEGKLADQHADDEPAEKLLARISAERAAAGVAKKSRGQTTGME
jgi:type I restriction enzyme S subunit